MDEQRIHELLTRAEDYLSEARSILNDERERAGGREVSIRERLRNAYSALSSAIDEAGG